MKFDDLIGLKKPIVRLIEVLAAGIGRVAAPMILRKNADAQAYELRTISEAIKDSREAIPDLHYEGGIISATSPEYASTYSERIESRVAYFEAKKQQNLESISIIAAHRLDQEEDVPEESPTEEWISRFFSFAEDISSEEMKKLWGEVLAGEIKQPGSFSLRTLDALRNISKEEAEIFVKVSRIVIRGAEIYAIPLIEDGRYLKSKFNINLRDILLLRELGLLFPTDLQFVLNSSDENPDIALTCGNSCIWIRRPKDIPTTGINSVFLTSVGKQLLSLIEKEEADIEYIKKFTSYFRQENVKVLVGKLISDDGTNIQYENMKEI